MEFTKCDAHQISVDPTSPQTYHRSHLEKATALPQWPWKNHTASVGAHSRLDFGFVDVEVGVDVLHVIVLFESFDKAHHLRGLRARQLNVVLPHHSHFPRPTLDSLLCQ